MVNDATLARARKISSHLATKKPASATAHAEAAGKPEAFSALSSASAVAAVPKRAAPTFQECRALFEMVAQCLRDASLTDEPHKFSGESDRLLRIGSHIALEASKMGSPDHHENEAYDVAACINAARLVPDDVESAVRTALIDTAAVALASIAVTTPEQIVFADVRRPSRTGKPTVMLTRDQIMAMHFDAMCWMGCAKAVLELYAASADSAAIFGLRDLLSTYYAKVQESEARDEVGDFIDGILPDMSCSLDCIVDLITTVLIDHDEVALHGVAYLLEGAKAIADGERLGTNDGGAA